MKLNELKERTLKKFNFEQFLRAHLGGQNFFPLSVSLKRISGKELTDNFSEHRKCIEELATTCKDLGIQLNFTEFKHRTLGTQSLPREVIFNSKEIFLQFIGKEEEFFRFHEVSQKVLYDFPDLKPFFLKSPYKILEFESSWQGLLETCKFFLQSPRSGLYLRQLEIPGIDTKFIEAHKRILSELLNILLPESGRPQHIPSLDINFFEERYGLKQESPRLRFRLLDQNLAGLFYGADDIEIPVACLSKNEIPCETVLIVENKTTGLSLSEVSKGIVFFELGYKAHLLKEIHWLKNRRLIYWGDLDTHGFAILSQLRQYFPHIESRLMDKKTLLDHRHLWTLENSPYLGDGSYLTAEELDVFKGLVRNDWGHQVRLEQERIAISKFII